MGSPVEKKPKFKAAFDGIKNAIKRDFSVKLMLLIALVVIVGSVILDFDFIDRIVIIFICFVVLALELINTAIELLADIVDSSSNTSIESLKDISAGAVLLVSLGALIVGFSILLKYLGGH